jgi:hypothetical protein
MGNTLGHRPERLQPVQPATADDEEVAISGGGHKRRRRPPPYHSALERKARASAGSRGHEGPANRTERPTTSDRAWTRARAGIPSAAANYLGRSRKTPGSDMWP